eukprot:13210940-Ditylum_brightwellii.AAC.1
MVVNALASQSDRTAEKPGKRCQHFFNYKTAGLADKDLNTMFKTLGLHQVGFVHSLVTRMYNGDFTYQDSSTPCNFSAFCLFETNLLCTKQQGRHLLLHLVEAQGQKQTIEECKVSAKWIVKTPTDATQLERQLEIYKTSVMIFFNKDIIFYKCLNRLYKIVVNKIATFETRAVLGESFATKFLYCIDGKFQRFLCYCKVASDRSEVDDDLLNINYIINRVLDNMFVMNLPPLFKIVDNQDKVENTLDLLNNDTTREGEKKKAGSEDKQMIKTSIN